MLISNAVYADGELRLKTSSADARRFAFHFNEGNYEIVKEKKRRSLDANAYYWKLVGDLASVLNMPPEEIYQRHIRDLGNYEIYCMQQKALEAFKRLWCSNHLGRTVETRESKLEGCTTVLAYYGSSDFDTKQMSRLIDNCIQDCKAVGVETRPPEEINSLLEAWDGR